MAIFLLSNKKPIASGGAVVACSRIVELSHQPCFGDLFGFETGTWISRITQTKLRFTASAFPSPPSVRATATPNQRPTPSTLFDPDPATIPSNPRSGAHEAAAAKLEL